MEFLITGNCFHVYPDLTSQLPDPDPDLYPTLYPLVQKSTWVKYTVVVTGNIIPQLPINLGEYWIRFLILNLSGKRGPCVSR